MCAFNVLRKHTTDDAAAATKLLNVCPSVMAQLRPGLKKPHASLIKMIQMYKRDHLDPISRNSSKVGAGARYAEALSATFGVKEGKQKKTTKSGPGRRMRACVAHSESPSAFGDCLLME